MPPRTAVATAPAIDQVAPPSSDWHLNRARFALTTDRPRFAVDILNDIRAAVRDLSHTANGTAVYNAMLVLQMLANNVNRYQQAPEPYRPVCIELADLLAYHLADRRLTGLAAELGESLKWDGN
jgi:hypothetical protein